MDYGLKEILIEMRIQDVKWKTLELDLPDSAKI